MGNIPHIIGLILNKKHFADSLRFHRNGVLDRLRVDVSAADLGTVINHISVIQRYPQPPGKFQNLRPANDALFQQQLVVLRHGIRNTFLLFPPFKRPQDNQDFRFHMPLKIFAVPIERGAHQPLQLLALVLLHENEALQDILIELRLVGEILADLPFCPKLLLIIREKACQGILRRQLSAVLTD